VCESPVLGFGGCLPALCISLPFDYHITTIPPLSRILAKFDPAHQFLAAAAAVIHEGVVCQEHSQPRQSVARSCFRGEFPIQVVNAVFLNGYVMLLSQMGCIPPNRDLSAFGRLFAWMAFLGHLVSAFFLCYGKARFLRTPRPSRRPLAPTLFEPEVSG
jgi:hypothetical protein